MTSGKVVVLLSLLASVSIGQVPGIINDQGRVVVNGTNFTGAGQFKFALVDGAGSRHERKCGRMVLRLVGLIHGRLRNESCRPHALAERRLYNLNTDSDSGHDAFFNCIVEERR